MRRTDVELSEHMKHGPYAEPAPEMGNTLSDLQQQVMANIAAMQQSATQDPYLNGRDAERRLHSD